MTIVLQHQYSHLKIYKDRFEIQLSFNRIPELLVVPFAAITGFVDPSVPFGLQLAGDPAAGLENSIGMLVPGLPQPSKAPTTLDDDLDVDELEKEQPGVENELGAFDGDVEFWDGEETSVPSVFPSKKGLREVNSDQSEPESAEEEDDDDEVSANIVQLDAFRKKSK